MFKVFSVFDSKAAAYLPPFVCPTRGVAVRAFQQAALAEGHDFNKFAEDYTLFELGDWFEEEGRFVNYSVPEMVQSALSIKTHAANSPLRVVDGGKES